MFLSLFYITVNHSNDLLNLPSNFLSIYSSIYSSNNIESSDSYVFTLKRVNYDPISFFTSNSIKYKILSDHIGVIEPYAEMKLHILSKPNDQSVPTSYAYTICSMEDTSQCYSGNLSTDGANNEVSYETTTIPCQPNQVYTINLSIYVSSQSTPTFSQSGTLICMYVRREIRALSTIDLAKTMNAMATMWYLKEEEGIDKYGDGYHHADYLLKFHYFNSAWQDADHIHEGNGFLAQHVKLTNIFEKSMQSIDPSITLPYWDFTIERATGLEVWESPIFTADTFGSLNLPTDETKGWTYSNDPLESAAIPDGRWANLPASKNVQYQDLNFGFGYLRAPWSMNPSPYLSRFTSVDKKLPTCQSHYNLLSDYPTLMDFFFMSPYSSHAPTHGTIGGVYGCDKFDNMLSDGLIIDAEAQNNLCKNWIFYMKEFYRLNYLLPQKDCGEGVDLKESLSSCKFQCNSDKSSEMIIGLKHILNSDNPTVPSDLSEDQWIQWKDFICDGDGYMIFGGDHLESASAADPSFWPIHPTLERLLHAKYLYGGFASESWANSPNKQYVCDKASCYDSNKGGFDFWDSCCDGHYPDSKLLDPIIGDRNTFIGLTNQEVIDMTNPTSDNYSMTYIYDGFEWTHCLNDGLDFSKLLNDNIEKAKNRDSSTVDTKSKLQTSTGGLKDKANSKIGTSNLPDKSEGTNIIPPIIPK